MAPPTLPMCWMSYVPPIGTRSQCQVCVVSVVLDADAYRMFSGIRLMIVHQGGLDGPELSDCHESEKYGNHGFTGFPPTKHNDNADTKSYRTMLSRHRDAVTLSTELLERCLDGGTADHSPSRPLCTIVFELRNGRQTSSNGSHFGMVLLQETTSFPRLRIIYDRAVPCSVTERSLVAFLELTRPYTFANDDAGLDRSTLSSAIFKHSIRIIPLSESRPPFRGLPTDVLHRIAWHAFFQRKRGFRTQLLSWGLVCKAWLPLLDIFYQGLGSAGAEDTPDPGAVARTLEHRPEKGRLIKVISPSNYAGAHEIGAERCEWFSRAFITILKLATTVQHLTLPMVHPPLRENLIQTLCTLNSVQVCHADAFYLEDLGFFSMYEIQKFTARWPVLRQLHVRLWEDRGCTDDHEEDQSQRYFTKLELLLLYKGTMTGGQLLRFASPSHSSLRDLSLHSIKGLLNSDLLALLLRVSPTLTKLSIKHCAFPRTTEDEEYAIDVSMSGMECLTSASITGPNLATVLTIARKPQRKSSNSKMRMSISIDGCLRFDMRGIVAALKTTGWSAIHIGRSGPESGWDGGLVEEARRVALDRRLKFSHVGLGRIGCRR